MTEKELVARAIGAKKYAYSPYSGFHVGAAILCKDGSLYTGCNIENSSYGITICAERTALFKAVSEGHTDDFEIMAVTGDSESFCMPSGACRQALSEFAPDLPVFLSNRDGEYYRTTVAELLPGSFGPEHLSGK